MIKPEECKICNGNEFKLHDTLEVYNPETDTDEIEKEVYECTNCGTLYFETEEFIITQIIRDPNYREFKTNVGKYMNS